MPLRQGHYDDYNRHWLTNGSPTGLLRTNLPRTDALNDLAATASGVMVSVAMHLEVGETVTNISFCSGGTAAGTPTHWWFALYNSAATPALLAQTADQTSGAWAADTVKTLALATPQFISKTGLYYCSLSVTATTPPTMMGALMGGNASRVGLAGAFVTGALPLAQTSGSALGASAPATIASPTAVAGVPFVAVT